MTIYAFGSLKVAHVARLLRGCLRNYRTTRRDYLNTTSCNLVLQSSFQDSINAINEIE